MRHTFLVFVLLVPVFSLEPQVAPNAWRIVEPATLSIGSRDAEGPELFGYVAGVLRQSSGNIIVADGKALELRLFSPMGRFLGTIGRKGAGPGEFQQIAQIGRCAGDSIFVYDPSLFRMSVFDPQGKYVRGDDIREWTPDDLPPYDFWCHPAGVMAFVHRTFEPPKTQGPLRHNVQISLVIHNDSSVILGTFPASEMYFKPPSAGPRHLGKQTTVAVGANSAYVGTGDAFEVLQFSLSGQRMAAVRESRATKPVTEAQIAAYISEFIRRRQGKVNTSRYQQYFRELEWPKTYPAYGRLLVDGADNLWIQEYPIPGIDTREWTIFGRSARRIARVTLPKDFNLLEAGNDWVLGVWRDEFDVDYIRLYHITK